MFYLENTEQPSKKSAEQAHTLFTVKNNAVVPSKPMTRLMRKALEQENLSPIKFTAAAKRTARLMSAPTESNKTPVVLLPRLKDVGNFHVQNTSVAPGKRTARLLSVPSKTNKKSPAVSSPIKDACSIHAKNTSARPAKHTARLKSVCEERDEQSEIDSISRLIALNCKLTNEILETKKVLCEKNNTLLKIQQKLFEKEVETIDLKHLLSKQLEEIEMLKKEVSQLKDERFVTDLINFDAEYHTHNLRAGLNDDITSCQKDLITGETPAIQFETTSGNGQSTEGHSQDEETAVCQADSVIDEAPAYQSKTNSSQFQWSPTD